MLRLALTAVITLLCLANESFALLRVGIKGGVALANLKVSESNSVDYKTKPGLSFGLAGEIPITPGGGAAVRTDVLYVQKGSNAESASLGTSSIHIDELVVAPFLVIRIPAARVIPFLQAGPEFSYNLKAKQDGGVLGEFRRDWRDGNVSFNAGAGFLLPAGPGDVTIDARYNLGLMNLNLAGSNDIKTNSIQLFLGYNFIRL